MAHRTGNLTGNSNNFSCIKPYAAFSGFIHGLRHRYSFFIRTIPGISRLLKPLDDAINTIDAIIKVLLQGYTFNLTERTLFSLPAKYYRIGLIIPYEIFQKEYKIFREITKEITNKVMRNEIQFQDYRVSSAKIKSDIKNR